MLLKTDKIKREDVLSSFAGLRPLLKEQGSDGLGQTSRQHKVIKHSETLYSLLGGKWTTFRRMSEDMARVVYERLRNDRFVSMTKNMPFYGGTVNRDDSSTRHLFQEEGKKYGEERLEKVIRYSDFRRLIQQYGMNYPKVIEYVMRSEQDQEKLNSIIYRGRNSLG